MEIISWLGFIYDPEPPTAAIGNLIIDYHCMYFIGGWCYFLKTLHINKYKEKLSSFTAGAKELFAASDCYHSLVKCCV